VGTTVLILLAAAAVGALMLWPRLARNPLWRAALTPLASIIGSGFLVLGPILGTEFGWMGLPVMAVLCLGAVLFGWAIRWNIATRQIALPAPGSARAVLEVVSSWALAFAYVISVAYYLNLFGAFGVSLTPLRDAWTARLVTTAMFGVILVIGWTRGFSALERVEEGAVGLKLAIIAGLLMGLVLYFWDQTSAGALIVDPPRASGWQAVTLIFGLVVTVQGFETSRYLGQAYPAALRRRSMLLAQAVASAIYLIYIALVTFTFSMGDQPLTETAIVDLMGVVAPVLPVMLVIAALAAQLSAAVADTNGSGGLLEELTHGRLSSRAGYAVLVAIGVTLTWVADVFQIISYASRAFALYYGLQAAIAVLGPGASPAKRAAFAALAVLGLACAIFGTPVEGG